MMSCHRVTRPFEFARAFSLVFVVFFIINGRHSNNTTRVWQRWRRWLLVTQGSGVRSLALSYIFSKKSFSDHMRPSLYTYYVPFKIGPLDHHSASSKKSFSDHMRPSLYTYYVPFK